MKTWRSAGLPWRARSSRTAGRRPAPGPDPVARGFPAEPPRTGKLSDAPERSRWSPIVLAVLALAGIIVTTVITRPTPGYGVDSAVYLGVAHNLVHGRGPTVPMTFYTDHYSPATAYSFHGAVPSTHFPPLYPAVLALFESMGLSAGAAVRWSSAGLHAVNLGLVALLLAQVLTRRRWLGAFAGAAVLLTIGTWLATHTFAMSEVLLITFLLATLLLLSRYLVAPSPHALAAVAACASGAVLTRWVGGSVAVTATALILLRDGWPARVRFGRAAIVGGSAATSAIAWTLYGRIAGGSTPRVLAYHPPQRFLGAVFETIGAWFISSGPSIAVVVVLGAVLAAGAVICGRRRPGAEPADATEGRVSQGTWVVRGCAVFAVCYVLVVYAARTFFDRSIPTGATKGILGTFEAPRIYVPLLPVVLVLVLAAVERIATGLVRGRHAVWAAAAVPAVCVAMALAPPGHVGDAYRDTARIVDTTRPHSTQTTLAMKFLPRDALIATNQPATVYGLTGRGCLMVPLRVVQVTGDTNPRYDREVAEMAAVLQRHHGYLVLFRAELGVSSASSASDFARWSKLDLLVTYPDGAIYRLSPR
jgi:hypothetical protein